MSRGAGPAARASLCAAGFVLALSSCTIGAGDGDPGPAPSVGTSAPLPTRPDPPPTTDEPADPEPLPPPPELTDLEELLDSGGLSDDDIGYERLLESAEDYGLDLPTLNLCEDVDETDALRVDRVQHWWESPGWTTGEDPAVALSVELVVYEAGGGEAAMAAFQATLTNCPSRTLEDGASIAFEGTDPPPGALPGSVALRGFVTTPEGGEFQQVIVAQRLGDLVGYLYVTGVDATATTEAARVSTILATRLTALAPQVAPGTPG